MYSSALRRQTELICQPCIVGKHRECESPGCPCLCNDEEVRFFSNKPIGLRTIHDLTESKPVAA